MGRALLAGSEDVRFGMIVYSKNISRAVRGCGAWDSPLSRLVL